MRNSKSKADDDKKNDNPETKKDAKVNEPESNERGRETKKSSVEDWLLSFKNRDESRKRVASTPTIENKKKRSTST